MACRQWMGLGLGLLCVSGSARAQSPFSVTSISDGAVERITQAERREMLESSGSENVSDEDIRLHIAKVRSDSRDAACGNQSGITPFVAAVQIRGWKRPAAGTNDAGESLDDRNDSPALNISGFDGGGVSLTACIPLVNRARINRGGDAGESSRGAFRVGWSLWGSVASLGDETEAHLTTGPTMYFHPRQANNSKASAVFGLTLGGDLIGWTPDYTTSFVGDNRATGLFQVGTNTEPETWSLVFNVGISLPEKKKDDS